MEEEQVQREVLPNDLQRVLRTHKADNRGRARSGNLEVIGQCPVQVRFGVDGWQPEAFQVVRAPEKAHGFRVSLSHH